MPRHLCLAVFRGPEAAGGCFENSRSAEWRSKELKNRIVSESGVRDGDTRMMTVVKRRLRWRSPRWVWRVAWKDIAAWIGMSGLDLMDDIKESSKE